MEPMEDGRRLAARELEALVHEFEIDSRVGEGTRVTIVRWK